MRAKRSLLQEKETLEVISFSRQRGLLTAGEKSPYAMAEKAAPKIRAKINLPQRKRGGIRHRKERTAL